MEHVFMWQTPIIYLLIVGLERLFWRKRYELIKSQIVTNVIVLTVVVLILNGLMWITNHVDICWK